MIGLGELLSSVLKYPRPDKVSPLNRSTTTLTDERLPFSSIVAVASAPLPPPCYYHRGCNTITGAGINDVK